jgi:hypothetical protein
MDPSALRTKRLSCGSCDLAAWDKIMIEVDSPSASHTPMASAGGAVLALGRLPEQPIECDTQGFAWGLGSAE